MNIPNRVKRFVEATNSFCIIMEDDEPQLVVAPFEWAERVFIGFAGEDAEDDTAYDGDIDEANSTISAVAQQERTDDIPTLENN